ncbi:MAG: LamG-like jellyroll fold domain-containing protein, partial [Planctomycetota bacterium]
RIDEVNGPNTWKGNVWVFETWGEFGPNFAGWWKFDEGSGSTAYDSAGSNNGILNGDPNWTTGQINGALDFNGANDYVETGGTFVDISGSTTKTIVGWAKSHTTDYSGGTGRILTVYRAGDISAFSIMARDSTWQGLYMKGARKHEFIDSGVSIIVDAWTHVALVQDGSGLNIYINGVPENAASNAVTPSITSPPNAEIGTGFDGVLDDVRVYRRALSAQEIQQIYENALGDVVGVEIIGPEEVRANCQGQYKALAYYEAGNTREVIDSVQWAVYPETIAYIDVNGLLTAKDIDAPEDITIRVEYTERGVTVEGVMTVQVALSETLHVPADYQTIQEAIEAAECGDTVIVADGIYSGEGNRDIDFLGKAITVRSESGPENCIIDCNGSKDDQHRAFYIDSVEGANCVVEGFTLINGLYRDGGLVYCRKASPTIENCILNASLAARGGAIYCRDSIAKITNCTIAGNSAEWDGGAVYCRGGSLTMVHCTVTANASEWDGGGIYFSSGSSLTINSSSISYNAAGYEGGAISCRNGTLRATNCAIVGNSADFQGGGVYCHRSNAIINNCTISGNSAPVGGGIHSHEGDPTITNSVLWGNSPEQIALEDGGTVSVTYSNVQGGPEGVWRDCYSDCSLDWGPGNIDTEAGFAFEDDYHLMPDSPCIDAGDPNDIPEPNETDLDGNLRVINGRLDMGAYEYNSQRPSIAI